MLFLVCRPQMCPVSSGKSTVPLFTFLQSWLKLNIKRKPRGHPAPSLHGKWKGQMWKQCQISSPWALRSPQMVMAGTESEDSCSWQESDDKPRQSVMKLRHYFAEKGLYSQSYGLSSSHGPYKRLNTE